jgi:propionyl-CoA synthetase
MFEFSLGENRELFWREQSKNISWEKKPDQILDSSNPPFYRWYPDAKLNVTVSCLDRWVES